MPAENEKGLIESALDRLNEFADELGLDGDDRNDFVDSAMQRKGFRKVSTWAEPEPEDSGSGGNGDFFSRRRDSEGEKSRTVSGGRSNGPDWQYKRRSS